MPRWCTLHVWLNYGPFCLNMFFCLPQNLPYSWLVTLKSIFSLNIHVTRWRWGQYLAKKLNFWVHSQKNPFTNWKTKRALYMKYQKRGICGKMVFKESGLFSFQGNICRAGHESPHWEGVLMKVQVLVGAVAQGEGFADFEVYEVCGPV